MKVLQGRPYQVEAAQKTKDHLFAGINNQVVELPTGTGKTVLFGLLPRLLKIGNRRMLVLVHREELAKQAVEKLRLWNPTISIGTEMGSKYANDSQIIVAGVQTLGKEGSQRLADLDPEQFAIIVTDECHHAVAESYQRIFRHFQVRTRTDILNLGVTATTKRGDGKGLKGTYDVVSYSMSLLTAIRDGWLSDLRGKRIITGVDFDSIAIKNGDFDPTELVAKLNTDVNNDLIVKHYQAEAGGRKFIAFCQDVAHSQALAESFRKKGLAVEAVWGADPDRSAKLERHRNNETIGLINAELLTEGYDDWQIRCVIIDKVTLSEAKYRQMVGRGTRIEEGINNRVEALKEGYPLKKPDCLILDVVGNSTKHSLHTLPTLFGFGTNTNLKDKTVIEAVEEVEELQLHQPLLDVKGLDDISNLKSYAETVNLMAELALPELIQISEYKWQKIDNDSYALPLKNNEAAFVIQDQAGTWHAKGSVNTYKLEGEFPDLESAIKECDYNIRMCGGRMWTAKAKRTQKLDSAPATEASLHVMRMYGMEPPAGITQGMAQALIFKAINQKQFEAKNQEGS